MPHRIPTRRRPRPHDPRPSAHHRCYTRAWEKASRAYRRAHPLCAECARQGISTAAALVDHIIPHKGDPVLFWDQDNWQSLCINCHNAKTARENHAAPPLPHPAKPGTP